MTQRRNWERLRPRTWWQWVLAGFAALTVIGAVVPSDDGNSTSPTTATVAAQPAPVVPTLAQINRKASARAKRHHATAQDRSRRAHHRPRRAAPTPTPAPAPTLPASYGGLGATVAAFKAHNPTHAPAVPVPGVATYTIEDTDSEGRVIAYSVQITAQPPMGNSERMFLTEGINLPDDARGVGQTSTCESFKSRTFEQIFGKAYAEASTVPGTDTAQIELVSTPDC